jgi:hypothetical protein
MPGKPNNLPIIIVAVAALGGIVLLNMFQQGNDPVIQEKIQKEAERKAQEEAQKKAGTPAPPPDAPQTPGANEVVLWGAESLQGKPGGSPKVTLGWTWTPTVQNDPSTIYSAVQGVKKVLPNAEIRVVDLDLKPNAVPAGIAVKGKVEVPVMPDGTIASQEVLFDNLKKSAQ